jgi:hypothetical protein
MESRKSGSCHSSEIPPCERCEAIGFLALPNHAKRGGLHRAVIHDLPRHQIQQQDLIDEGQTLWGSAFTVRILMQFLSDARVLYSISLKLVGCQLSVVSCSLNIRDHRWLS